MGRGKSLKNVVDDAVWVWGGGGWCGHTCAGAIVVKLPMMKKMTKMYHRSFHRSLVLVHFKNNFIFFSAHTEPS